MNYKKMGGYKRFQRSKMDVARASQKVSSGTAEKQNSIESDQPVTKMKGQPMAHGGGTMHSGEYGTKHQVGLPTPKGNRKKAYSRAAIMSAMGGGGGTYGEARTLGHHNIK